jgi:hypothetical protein
MHSYAIVIFSNQNINHVATWKEKMQLIAASVSLDIATSLLAFAELEISSRKFHSEYLQLRRRMDTESRCLACGMTSKGYTPLTQ